MSAVHPLDVFANLDFRIKIESGVDLGRIFKISPPMISVGRGTDCSVMLNDPKVSRIQCQIEFRDEITLVDKSRRQTTFLNGNKISKSVLRPGDVISFGDTRIRFITESKAQSPTLVNDSIESPELPKFNVTQNRRPLIYGTLLVVIGAVITLSMNEKSSRPLEKINLIRTQELKAQIEASETKSKEEKEAFVDKYGDSPEKYRSKINTHFIRGYRDLQSMNFERAETAFGATLAKDPSHKRAKRFQELARQKKEEAIEKHLYYGNDYSEKLMFNRCASEFEKAMVLINQPSSKKYQLAKVRKKQCEEKSQRGGI